MNDPIVPNMTFQNLMRQISRMSAVQVRETFNQPIATMLLALFVMNSNDAEFIERHENLMIKRREAASRMADLIIDITNTHGSCTEADLLRAGFAPEAIADLKLLAYSIVAERLPAHTKTIN